MKQTKFWILLFAALAILGCGAFLLLRSHGQTGQTAVIRVDGEGADGVTHIRASPMPSASAATEPITEAAA